MYIRTKDGRIIDTTKYPEHPASWSVQASDYALTIAQSENLEELCDEFVMVDNSNNKPYRPFIIYGRSLEELNERQSCNESIYGAIWTDKGLIYVAKMDSDGKLVLI